MITQQVAQYLIKKAKERAHSLKSRALNKTEEHLKSYLSSRGKEPKFNVMENNAAVVDAFNWRMSWLVSTRRAQTPQVACGTIF